MAPKIAGFFRSRLFFLWLVIVGICLMITLFVRLEIGEKIRSHLQDGWVELTSTPTGAQVLIDEKYSGLTPLHKKLRAGTYQIIFKRGEWEIPQETAVRARETSQASVRFNYATLDITSQPAGLDVFLGPTKIGTTPCMSSEVSPGNWTLTYRQGNRSVDENIEIKESETLRRAVTFELFQSTIRDGDTLIKAVPEPPYWIGVWTGHMASSQKQEKPAVSKLQINPDLHTGILFEHLGFLPIEVPVSLVATGTRLEAQGSILSGNTSYMADCVLTRIPGRPQASVEILRRYFYLNAPTSSSKASGILDKVSGL
jgi:hypothetical protein